MQLIATTAHIIESVCGSVPRTCPWHAFNHPLVVDVMAVRRAQRAKVFTNTRHLPVRLLDAIAFFDDALKAARADKLERERIIREAKRKTKPTNAD